MHLLLAMLFGAIMYFSGIAQSLYRVYLERHVPTELEEMRNMSKLTIYGDCWMIECNAFQHKVPAEIRRPCYERMMTERWGENYLEINPNWKFDPAKTTTVLYRDVWDGYWSKKYGEKFARRYPFLAWPSYKYDDNGKYRRK